MELVSRRRSPPASLAGGGPARVPIRFPRYPVFKVPGASYSPRPAASFRPRRKEIYYAHPLPRSRGFSFFFWVPARIGAVLAIRPGATRFYCLSGRAHIPSISPGREFGCGAGHLDARGREPTKCSRARLAKRARSLGTPSTCRAESFEAKSAEGVDASLYIVALCHAEILPAS